ncbi:MAG: hypothetical protein ACM3UP_02170 [Methanocella sp.]
MNRCRVCENLVLADNAGKPPWCEEPDHCLAGHDPDYPPKRCKDVRVGEPMTMREYQECQVLEAAGL